MTRAVELIAVVAVACFASVAAAQEWTKYEAAEYGFSMLAPAGTAFAEKEWEDGWGGLSAGVEGVELYRLAKLGAKASEEEIQKVGMELTGVPEEAWKEVEAGKDSHGMSWWKAVKAPQPCATPRGSDYSE